MSAAQFRPTDAVDFVVIGIGAAGGVMAKELSTAGFRVVALEQGPWRHEKDFKHDEVSVMFRHGLTNDPAKQPNTFRKTPGEPVQTQQAVEYGQMVGGGSVHFTTNYWRFHPEDFRERSVLGPIAGADLRDWPITYDDLEPYYTKAEWDLGISGLGGSNPFDGPRSKPYPLPPMPVKSSGVLFERAAKKLGLHPFPAPLAVLSEQFRGRPACVHCGYCEAFGCEVGAKSSTLAAVVPAAVKTGRCEIRPNSYVRKIEVGKDGRVSGAIYFDSAGREVFQRAKAVVVCANGAETPRLLLMSKSNAFPQGLANSNGNVGKHLMFDNGAMAMAFFEHPLNEYKSVVVTRVLHDYYRSDPKRGFYGGGGIDGRFDYYPAGFALGGMPPDGPQWGSGMEARHPPILHACRRYARPRQLSGRRAELRLPGRSGEGCLGIAGTARDLQESSGRFEGFGIHCRASKGDSEAAGAKKVWVDPATLGDTTLSRHLMGACRMGDDPKTSVVNKWNRAHDVPNLFLVDGSSLVTSARQQPTATIQALAYRAADHIHAAAKRGEI